jgi:ketosteroid isomerase-like protein
MSHEDVEHDLYIEGLVSTHYEAFNARNPEALMDTCTADVEIDDRLRVDAGLYRGREQVRAYFDGLWEVSRSAEVEPVELRCHRDRVWVRATVWAQGQASGAAAGITFAHVFTILDGRIKRIEVYLDPTEALEAVGLSEKDAHDSKPS